MGTGVALGFAFVGMFVAAIGVFFFGELALMFAILMLGVAVLGLAMELEARTTPKSTPPTHPVRTACPGCGGDVYEGQASCPECGHAWPAGPPPNG